MKKYSIDPFPAPEESEKNNLWIYGRAEREAFLLQQLIRAKNDARLKVGYPGEFMLPHNTMYFKAEFPAGKFPVSVTGSPAITEINMAAPGSVTLDLAHRPHDGTALSGRSRRMSSVIRLISCFFIFFRTFSCVYILK